MSEKLSINFVILGSQGSEKTNLILNILDNNNRKYKITHISLTFGQEIFSLKMECGIIRLIDIHGPPQYQYIHGMPFELATGFVVLVNENELQSEQDLILIDFARKFTESKPMLIILQRSNKHASDLQISLSKLRDILINNRLSASIMLVNESDNIDPIFIKKWICYETMYQFNLPLPIDRIELENQLIKVSV